MTRAALRNRAIRVVVAGFAAMTVAEWMLGTALAVHAYSVGGALMVGLVGFRFAPAAIAGLWTTQLSDHPTGIALWPSRRAPAPELSASPRRPWRSGSRSAS